MKTTTLLACALLAAPGLALLPSASAQTHAARPPVADPAAPVPAPRYRPAFATPAGKADPAPADWKDANAEVGQFRRGHADILKWEEAQTPSQRVAPHGAPSTVRATP